MRSDKSENSELPVLKIKDTIENKNFPVSM